MLLPRSSSPSITLRLSRQFSSLAVPYIPVFPLFCSIQSGGHGSERGDRASSVDALPARCPLPLLPPPSQQCHNRGQNAPAALPLNRVPGAQSHSPPCAGQELQPSAPLSRPVLLSGKPQRLTLLPCLSMETKWKVPLRNLRREGWTNLVFNTAALVENCFPNHCLRSIDLFILSGCFKVRQRV